MCFPLHGPRQVSRQHDGYFGLCGETSEFHVGKPQERVRLSQRSGEGGCAILGSSWGCFNENQRYTAKNQLLCNYSLCQNNGEPRQDSKCLEQHVKNPLPPYCYLFFTLFSILLIICLYFVAGDLLSSSSLL